MGSSIKHQFDRRRTDTTRVRLMELRTRRAEQTTDNLAVITDTLRGPHAGPGALTEIRALRRRGESGEVVTSDERLGSANHHGRDHESEHGNS